MPVPASIDELCAQHGLLEYLPMMHDNEVDLDLVRDLSAADWMGMGMPQHAVNQLMAATKTLPPGSFRFWGSGQNPVAAAVKKAMTEKPSQLKPAEKPNPAQKPDARMARFGAAAKKNAPDKQVHAPVCSRRVTAATHRALSPLALTCVW